MFSGLTCSLATTIRDASSRWRIAVALHARPAQVGEPMGEAMAFALRRIQAWEGGALATRTATSEGRKKFDMRSSKMRMRRVLRPKKSGHFLGQQRGPKSGPRGVFLDRAGHVGAGGAFLRPVFRPPQKVKLCSLRIGLSSPRGTFAVRLWLRGHWCNFFELPAPKKVERSLG